MILTAKLITDCYNQGNHVFEDECKWDILVSMVKLVQEGNLVASKNQMIPFSLGVFSNLRLITH